MGISRRRADPPAGVDVKDAWSAGYAISGGSGAAPPASRIEDEREVKAGRSRFYDNCRCNCRCGSRTGDPNGLCYLCGQGVHHRCSRACKAFEPEMTVYHGVKALTNYVPARQECDGGQYGPRGAPQGRRRV